MSNKFLKFNIKKAILFSLLFILSLGSAYFLLFKKQLTPAPAVYQFKNTEEIVNVVILADNKDTYLTKDNISKIYTPELYGNFLVGVKDGYTLSSVLLDGRHFDIYNKENDNSVKIIKEDGGYLKISPLYIIDPSNHELQVDILNNLGEKTKHIYKFAFIYNDNFSDEKKSKNFWLQPSRSKYSYSPDLKWEIFDNTLQGISLDPKNNSDKFVSTYFFRRLGGDINLSFDIKITSLKPNLTIYFLESKNSFVIGNGSNRVLSYIDQDKTYNYDFDLELNNTYRCEVNRNGQKYTLNIASTNNPKISKTISFIADEVARLDTVGLSIWGSSNGVKITNASVWGQK